MVSINVFRVLGHIEREPGVAVFYPATQFSHSLNLIRVILNARAFVFAAFAFAWKAGEFNAYSQQPLGAHWV